MKCFLKTAAWISTGIALALMLLGIIAKLSGGLLFSHWWANYYYPAQNFLLAGIFMLLFTFVSNGKKEQ